MYGDPTVHPQPESYWGNVNPIGPRACYDEGKRVAETLMSDYHREDGVDIRIARIFNTYGPRMAENDGRVVSNFIVQALRGQELTLYGTGQQTRSFCYVDDLVEGLVRLMDSEGRHEPVNLGNPVEFTIRELAEEVVKVVGGETRVTYKPLPQDDPTQRQPDISRAREWLGWEPQRAAGRRARADRGVLPPPALAPEPRVGCRRWTSRLTSPRLMDWQAASGLAEFLALSNCGVRVCGWSIKRRRGSQPPSLFCCTYLSVALSWSNANRGTSMTRRRAVAPISSLVLAAGLAAGAERLRPQPGHRQERAVPGLRVAGDPDGPGVGAAGGPVASATTMTRRCRPTSLSIGMKMAKASERPNLPWEFHVVNDASVNAFALPGGFIYVTRGLMTSINDEAELATVIGHEIGHVTNRHSVQQISKAQVAQLGLGLGSILSSDVARVAGLASQGLGVLFLKYSRDAENQADLAGFRYALDQNYDVREMANVFQTLDRISNAPRRRRQAAGVAGDPPESRHPHREHPGSARHAARKLDNSTVEPRRVPAAHREHDVRRGPAAGLLRERHLLPSRPALPDQLPAGLEDAERRRRGSGGEPGAGRDHPARAGRQGAAGGGGAAVPLAAGRPAGQHVDGQHQRPARGQRATSRRRPSRARSRDWCPSSPTTASPTACWATRRRAS